MTYNYKVDATGTSGGQVDIPYYAFLRPIRKLLSPALTNSICVRRKMKSRPTTCANPMTITYLTGKIASR